MLDVIQVEQFSRILDHEQNMEESQKSSKIGEEQKTLIFASA